MKENNIKALFPEDIETITISKDDYDRLYGQLTYKNIVLQSKIDKAIEYINHEIKDMPLNGCKERLNKLLSILQGEDNE